jgi:copper chaperone CopZ
MKTAIFVQNLKCGGCAHTISTKLAEIKNISNLNVDIDQGKISFEYFNENDAFQVKEKLITLGYPSIEDNNDLLLKAKSFVSCATGKISK